MKYSPRLDRCAYGVGSIGATTGQASFVSLYNEASSPSYLAVRDFSIADSTSTQPFFLVVAQGTVGTFASQGQSVVTNGPAQAGSIYTGSVVTPPAFNFPTPGGAQGPYWFHNFPALVLTPGFSLTAYRVAVNQALNFGFWWELLWPDQKINPWIGDPEVDD